MFIIIIFDRVLTRSSVSSQDFYCSLPRDQSRDVTPRMGVSINWKYFISRSCIYFPATIITTM